MKPAWAGWAGWAGCVGALATVAAGPALRRHPPGGPARWARTNHAGASVTLLEGPQVVLGSAVATAVVGSPAAALAALASGALGALDDLAGDSSSKGLRGHLGALTRGQVTTGAVKVLGLLGVGAVVASTARAGRSGPMGEHECRTSDSGPSDAPAPGVRLLQLLVDAGVVAGSANLANLLDLRPGRALKATVLLGTPLALLGSPVAAVAVGSALAAAPDDLAGRSMLGDTGANSLGALLGVAAVERLPQRGRRLVLLGLVTLTLLSERISFTAVIEANPVLRELDRWGRPPASPAPTG
ncbi:MAG: hypothetical protein ABI243_02325 [Lapillicoccus sp.]